MKHKCKRIIDGKTYNTETATRVEGYDDFDSGIDFGAHLFQTRFGAFFSYEYRFGFGDDDYEKINPLSPSEAQKWLEEKYSWQPELIEKLFGEMPEAGMGEVKFTLRLPESLRNTLNELSKNNGQSLNAWIVRCLEKCAEGARNG